MQPTLALACGERSKLGCAPAWQLRHFASTSFIGALAGLKILVMSPPPSTCALPAPWQFSQVTPLLPCIRAILVCGLSANFLPTSSWQVTQVSRAHKIRRSGSLALGIGRLRLRGRCAQRSGAQYARAQHQHQTSSQSRSLPRNRTNRQSRYRPIFMHEKYRLGCSHRVLP